MPIATRGLNHLALSVRDPDRSLRFYRALFGVTEYYRDASTVQVLGPGRHDVLSFEKDARSAGRRGGMQHFGFRLARARDIDAAVAAARRAGARIVERGDFGGGQPYVFFEDPDGYVIEVWYEKATFTKRARRRS